MNNPTSRRVGAGLFAAALALTMVACSGGKGDDTPPPGSEPVQTEIADGGDAPESDAAVDTAGPEQD